MDVLVLVNQGSMTWQSCPVHRYPVALLPLKVETPLNGASILTHLTANFPHTINHNVNLSATYSLSTEVSAKPVVLDIATITSRVTGSWQQ
jgi:hypothetical protein